MADLQLWGRTLLPQNATPLMRALSEAAAEAVDQLPKGETIPDALSWERCDARLLPWLAWEYSVDEWIPAWSETTKRGAIADAWRLHSVKGTRGALEVAIDRLGLGAEIREWFDYDGAAYLFRLLINSPDGREWNARELGSLYRVALRTKNVRSDLEFIDLRIPGPKVNAYVGVGAISHVQVRPTVEPITYLAGRGSAFVGAVVHSRIRIRSLRG